MSLERATKTDLLTAHITGDDTFIRDVVHFDVAQIDTELMPTAALPPSIRKRQYLKRMNQEMYSRTFDLNPNVARRLSDTYVQHLSRYVLNMPLYLITSPNSLHWMHREVPEFYASPVVNFAAFESRGTTVIEPIIETASGDEALLPVHHRVLGGMYIPISE